MVLFSIIVANYNNGRYLDDLIQSVLKQTYTNWELIIADDASTDHSDKVVAKYLSDLRIHWHRHEVNAGAGAAFKTACDNSSGEIIGMLGADDGLVPEALDKMITAHSMQKNASMITSMAYDCDADFNQIGICKISGKQPEGVSFIREIHICNFVTFKKEFYQKTKGFEVQYKRGVDVDIYLKMEECGGTIGFLAEPVYLYRRHSGGISQGGNGTLAHSYVLWAQVEAYKRRKIRQFQPNLTFKEYQAKAVNCFQLKSYYARKEGHWTMAAGYALMCVATDKTYLLNKTFWSALFYNLIKKRAL